MPRLGTKPEVTFKGHLYGQQTSSSASAKILTHREKFLHATCSEKRARTVPDGAEILDSEDAKEAFLTSIESAKRRLAPSLCELLYTVLEANCLGYQLQN